MTDKEFAELKRFLGNHSRNIKEFYLDVIGYPSEKEITCGRYYSRKFLYSSKSWLYGYKRIKTYLWDKIVEDNSICGTHYRKVQAIKLDVTNYIYDPEFDSSSFNNRRTKTTYFNRRE